VPDGAKTGMRAETNFLSPFNAICPVQSCVKKETASSAPQINPKTPAILFRQRGVGRRHERWGRLRWTRKRWRVKSFAGRVFP
jgi:hypothetical protein